MVGLTGSAAVAGVGVIARARGRARAGERRAREAGVSTRAVTVALVLICALGPGISAVGPRGHVVGLTRSGPITGVGVIARARGRAAARRPRALEAVIGTRAVAVALVLICARSPVITADLQ